MSLLEATILLESTPPLRVGTQLLVLTGSSKIGIPARVTLSVLRCDPFERGAWSVVVVAPGEAKGKSLKLMHANRVQDGTFNLVSADTSKIQVKIAKTDVADAVDEVAAALRTKTLTVQLGPRALGGAGQLRVSKDGIIDLRGGEKELAPATDLHVLAYKLIRISGTAAALEAAKAAG